MYFLFSYLTDELTSELLAKEALALFKESRILGQYVSFDYKDEVAQHGEQVKVHWPEDMTAVRLAKGDSLQIDGKEVGVDYVPLDQHITKTLPFGDREKAQSWPDLVEYFLKPAVDSLVDMADAVIQGEKYRSHLYTQGKLGTALGYSTVNRAAASMTTQKVPLAGRHLFVGPGSGADLRDDSKFIDSASFADPNIIRNGLIGRIGGFDTHETNSFNDVAETTKYSGAVNNAAGYAIGTTTLTIDGLVGIAAAVVANSWVKIDGTPYRVTSTTGGTTPTAVVISTPLRKAVADNAAVEFYVPSTVNFASGYAVGYMKGIVFDGVTPAVGQGVSFGASDDPYSIIAISGQTLWLNRPLETAIADDARIMLMPGGSYSLAMHPKSIQVVNRPMSLPGAGQGADAFVVTQDVWSIRVIRSYDHVNLREIVSFDFLMGVRTLLENYNVLLLG